MNKDVMEETEIILKNMKFPVDILFQMLYTIFAVDETDKQLAERSGAGMVTVPDKTVRIAK